MSASIEPFPRTKIVPLMPVGDFVDFCVDREASVDAPGWEAILARTAPH